MRSVINMIAPIHIWGELSSTHIPTNVFVSYYVSALCTYIASPVLLESNEPCRQAAKYAENIQLHCHVNGILIKPTHMIVYLPAIQFGDNSGTQFVNRGFIYSAIHAPHAINYIMPTLWVLRQIAVQSPFMYPAVRIVSAVFGLDSIIQMLALVGQPQNHYIDDILNRQLTPCVVKSAQLCPIINKWKFPFPSILSTKSS